MSIKEDYEITIFHGSNHTIEKSVFHGGKTNNDYGKGSYTTTDQTKAEEWSLLIPGNSVCNK